MDAALAKLLVELDTYRKWHGVSDQPLRFGMPLSIGGGNRWQFLVWSEGKLPSRLELEAEDEAKAKQAVLELQKWANPRTPE